jgi:bifunctional UDP-N-acetylglucosamine pyrophosphorylase/glucosamine-1-phosphate N-acetyltransferase
LETTTASLILAAGRGSRMKDFNGNKTLLPLIPEKSHYEGKKPILVEILNNLPNGPKAVVVNHKKEDVIKATQEYDITYCEQPVLNGTGGALLSARVFLEARECDHLIITMGDVPLVKSATYRGLIENLKNNTLTVLGFRPEDKKQYGVLEVEGDQVKKIIEWKYWNTFSEKKQRPLQICNSGIYAVRTDKLLHYMSVLASRPHRVRKEIGGEMTEVEEFFITDIVEYMCDDGLPVGYVIGDENEVMGVDDLAAITKAQELYLKATQEGGEAGE